MIDKNYHKNYYLKNKERLNKMNSDYYFSHKAHLLEYQRKWTLEHKEHVRKSKADWKIKDMEQFPWKYTLSSIKQRCENQKHKRYKDYGGRGIKCLITLTELKELWFRDKACLMNKPSIDRINNDGDYTFSNCQYIELKINSGKTRKSIRDNADKRVEIKKEDK